MPAPDETLPDYRRPPPFDVAPGGCADAFSVPEAVAGGIDGDGGVDGSAGAVVDDAAAPGAGSMAGAVTGAAAIDGATPGAAMAALDETFLAAVTRFGVVARGRAVIVRRTVFF
jgi:hypothetical protein